MGYLKIAMVFIVLILLAGCTVSSEKKVTVDPNKDNSAKKSDEASSLPKEEVAKTAEPAPTPKANTITENKTEKAKPVEVVKEEKPSTPIEIKKLDRKEILSSFANGKNVVVTFDDKSAIIKTNDLPDHKTGSFPALGDSNNDGRPDNPNSIDAESITFHIPLMPTKSSTKTATSMGWIALSTSGSVFYNQYNAEREDAVKVEVFDACEGHPDPSGNYHYHQMSSCLEDTKESNGHSGVAGVAFDGYFIYGLYENGGIEPKDLDSCNGHEDESHGYHYHVTKNAPYILGCYSGVVDKSNFQQQGGRPPPGQGPPPPR